MTLTNKDLKRTIINSSKVNSLSHIGSCLSMVDLLDCVYKKRLPCDPVILSAGHSAVALYAVLEKYDSIDSQLLFDTHGVHPNRDIRGSKTLIYASSGSLGHGIGIGVGMALADRGQVVYCLVSDGELAEGSCWEALRVAAELNVMNLKLLVNYNGYGAYRPIAKESLIAGLQANGWGVYAAQELAEIELGLDTSLEFPVAVFVTTTSEQLPFLKGLDSHYHVMTDHEYEEAMELLQ